MVSQLNTAFFTESFLQIYRLQQYVSLSIHIEKQYNLKAQGEQRVVI